MKPNLLSLFEKFIVPLNPDILRSALKSLVLALLPGMEEETSEEFERTHSLLNIFRDRVTKELGQKNGAPENSGDQNFWQSLFLASITSSSRRQGALAYLCRELPVLGTPVKSLLEPHVMGTGTSSPIRQLPPNIEAMTSPEPGLLIRCFASGLQDEQLLIQRGFLDLLVSHLPLHADVLRQKVTSRDLELLVAAAANVVARREMSLNRRLWTWFLGPGVSASLDDDSPSTPQADSIATVPKAHNPKMSQTEYFERYGLTPLVNSVLSMVTNDSSAPAERARPFRICLSLMDRWEIGGLVVPRIFLPAMRSVWRYQTTASSKEALEEVLRSAKVFFGAVESNLIWAELGRVLIGALSDTNANADEVLSSDPQQSLDLVLFIINNFDVREEDMLVLHIPMVTLALLISLRQRLEVCLTADEHEAPQVVETALIIAVQLLDLLPAKTLNTSKQMMLNSDEAEPLKGNNPHTLQRIQDFYQELQRRPAGAIPPFQVEEVRQLLLQNSFEIVTQELSYSIRVKYLEKEILFLDKFIRKAQITDLQGSASSEHDGMKTIMSNLVRATDEIAFDKTSNFPFPVAAALVSAVETMSNALSSRTWNSNYRVRKILTNLLASLWVHISPSQPKNNVEAVRCLWRIHLVSPDSRLVEGSVATLMLKGQPGQRHQGIGIEGARHFTTLWAHSGSTFKSSTNNPSASGNTTRKSDHRGTTSDDEPMVLARPLLLLLDTLSDSNTELFVFTASWLQSLSSIQQ